jgi:hypothetical protein
VTAWPVWQHDWRCSAVGVEVQRQCTIGVAAGRRSSRSKRQCSQRVSSVGHLILGGTIFVAAQMLNEQCGMKRKGQGQGQHEEAKMGSGDPWHLESLKTNLWQRVIQPAL